MDKLCIELVENGVDIERVMERFMGNEALYIKFLKRFAEEDKSFQNMQEYFKKEEYGEAFQAAHTLKGLLANLGLDDIMHSVAAITEKLRTGSLEGTKELMEQAEAEYKIVMNILGKAVQNMET